MQMFRTKHTNPNTTENDAAQQAKFNQGTPHTPDPFDPKDGEDPGKYAMAQFADWQGNVLVRLGLTALTGDVKADNPTLIAALAKIAAAGAPEPKIETETVAWPGGDILRAGSFTVDVYVYYRNGSTARLTEFLLAACPDVAIRELKNVGVIAA